MRRKLYLYFHGIGDSLLFNTALYEQGRKTGEKFVVGSEYPEIYIGNPYVTHLPCRTHSASVWWRRFLKASHLVRGVEYVDYYDHGSIPSKHIFTLLCERIGLPETPSRPVIFLSDTEKGGELLPPVGKPWVGIQSTGNSVHTENKNWSVEKFQAVANELRRDYAVAQFGSKSDPPLDVDRNLCGVLSLREVFVALHQCRGFVGQVGFLMHAAAAVEVPSVIVYGGFEAPWQSGYQANINIYNPLPCAPCWLWGKKCPISKQCMTEISAEQVVTAFRKLLSQPVLPAQSGGDAREKSAPA